MTAVSSSCAVISNLDRVKNWEQLVKLPGFAIVCSFLCGLCSTCSKVLRRAWVHDEQAPSALAFQQQQPFPEFHCVQPRIISKALELRLIPKRGNAVASPSECSATDNTNSHGIHG